MLSSSVPRRSHTKFWLILVLILVVGVVGSVSYLAWRQFVPGVRVDATVPKFVGQKTPLTVVVQAARGRVATADVRVNQGGKTVTIARLDSTRAPRIELPATIEPAAAGLKEGGATVEVWARDDFWRPMRGHDRAVATFPTTIDLTPPPLEIIANTPYVAPGGAGLVVMRAGDAIRADTKVGGLAFPTFALGPQWTRVGFFALPYDYTSGTGLSVTAADEAGNTATRGIPAEILPRRFRKDTIEVTDAFLNAKVPELLPQRPPSQSLVDGFLVINRDQRHFAEEEKRRVSAKTADKPLWEGAFVQPRNTKVFSNFAETRTYRYQGRDVDTQVHVGYDLASTKQAVVPAANKGVIAYAGPLTIYGNTVIIDHGLGLQTLYGHLSSVLVKVGDTVDKGQELGRSGATGLAIGDHLHYEVLVHGVSVTPLEWWDLKWIRDRVAGPLKAAGVEIAGVDTSGIAPAAERPAVAPRPRARRAR